MQVPIPGVLIGKVESFFIRVFDPAFEGESSQPSADSLLVASSLCPLWVLPIFQEASLHMQWNWWVLLQSGGGAVAWTVW